MIQKIRTSKASKTVAMSLAFLLLMQIIAPTKAYALTGGPSQPEFSSFTPISTSDMVDLASGDFNYNIPIMDIGGYPLNLAYNSNVSMDQEASWVGLGWDLSVGQISRQMRGIPDDFDGDEMVYDNNMKENVTVGGEINYGVSFLSVNEVTETLSGSGGFMITLNNYNGFDFTTQLTGGLTLAGGLGVGMSLNSSATDGVNVSPSLSYSYKHDSAVGSTHSFGVNAGVSLNSRRGVDYATFGASYSRKNEKNTIKSITFSPGSSISFADAGYTPTKRVGMQSTSVMFNATLGTEHGIERYVKLGGFKTKQGIKSSEKHKIERAYGYSNTWNASDENILDYNLENDRVFSNYTTSLPVTNYTYDLYSIQGQGVGGMFRPYNSQVGAVNGRKVVDDSDGMIAGAELGWGNSWKAGFNMRTTKVDSYTRKWSENNSSIGKFQESKIGNKPTYEKVFYKNIGGTFVDNNLNSILNASGSYAAIRHGVDGTEFNRNLSNTYTGSININKPIKRTERLTRNQNILVLNRKDALNYGFDTKISPYSKSGKHDKHTTEIQVLKDGGERYIYGRAAYNITKKEVTFDVSGRSFNDHSGLVSYKVDSKDSDNSIRNKAGGDQYYSGITTPEYGHSYLLTSVLSSDYSDLTNNGPTDDDLGGYTKFVYNHKKTVNAPYKWRVPYGKNTANYDEGLKSSHKDDKGNYIYGEKELLYLDTIVTKTHIAIFNISARKDGYGVVDENGGGTPTTSSKMYKLDKIILYSKAEFKEKGSNAIPVKTAHFEYDYSLCTGIPNNFDSPLTFNELDNQGGKLTLTKVYFTYGKSNMGMYTPYKFTYGNNKPYDQRAYDTWGNYKPNPEGSGVHPGDVATNTEFPFVDQDKQLADDYSSAWLLDTVILPSGGSMVMEYESDEYRYVQDKEVMQMFKVVGAGKTLNPELSDFTDMLYTGQIQGATDTNNYLYVKLDKQNMKDEDFEDLNTDAFVKKYIRALANQPVYFRFLLNMARAGDFPDRYDYVTGYLEFNNQYNVVELSGQKYGVIGIKTVNKGDGFNSNVPVNPISKAGWHFGRQYLNNLVYNNPSDEMVDDLGEVLNNIVNSISGIADIMQSPNKQLIMKGIASVFKKEKSWIRLMNPSQRKLGGGSRVKSIKLYDHWNVMTNHSDDENYSQFYGQVYSYDDANGYTSGVATYEPIGNKENPWVQPFYDTQHTERLLGPDEQNFVEKPFGQCFFPAPKITYSQVTVKNLPRQKGAGEDFRQVKKHATGTVVSKFYTSRDFPTIVDYTDMYTQHDKTGALANMLKLSVKEHLTASQGFMVHTNDMDGKAKAQEVYAEGQTSPISKSEYFYDEVSPAQYAANPKAGRLNNTITTINSAGKVEQNLVGVDYDLINNYTENSTETSVDGINNNFINMWIGTFPLFIYVPLPAYSRNEVKFKSAVTTKVIHSMGILKEQKVTDAGSSVYTRNLAWDAATGNVILTETINEYNDKYYSFNYPAYWGYDGMGHASKNLGMQWKLKFLGGPDYRYAFQGTEKAADYLADGDELWIEPDQMPTDEQNEIYREDLKAYVINVTGNSFTLITEDGHYIKENQVSNATFTVTRSGRRNMQSASMASITSMVNPLTKLDSQNVLPATLYQSALWSDYRIINASAIEYNDVWPAQCECHLPKMKYEAGVLNFDYNDDFKNLLTVYNPYKFNIKGVWRANKSYAYLTGRNTSDNASVRNSGYYNNFHPFYIYDSSLKKWKVSTLNFDKWQSASEITQYNPYGFEVENKDALGRYSAAVYGYNYRFPVAVAANTKYSELAFDGFEDYGFNKCDTTAHFSLEGALLPHQIEVSSQNAHTGKKSLKVLPGNRATLKKQIIPCPSN